MIEEIKGDLFQATEDIIVHGCNCFNTMGSGVAKTVKKLYPGAWEADQRTVKGNADKLGTFTFWVGSQFYTQAPLVVVNLYTQYGYGSMFNRTEQIEYDALRVGLEELEFVFRGRTFAMPKIGAGLGGGDWDKSRNIIEESFTGHGKNELVRIYSL